MKVLINQNRKVNKINEYNTQNENKVTELTLELPEEYENWNKRIVFITDEGNFWDYIQDNTYLIKKNVTQYERVQFYIWLTNEEQDFRSEIGELSFNKNIEADDQIPTEEQIDGFNTLITTLNLEITRVNNKETELNGIIADLQHKLDTDYFKGEKGDTGGEGSPGISPTVETQTVEDGVEVTIKDAEGAHIFKVLNGKDGEIDEEVVSQAVTEYLDTHSIVVPTKTSDLTNDSDFVPDANYVHTDNNYSTQEKQKLAGLSNYDDTEVKQNITSLSNNKANKNEIPDVSSFITKSVNDLANYYLKNETYSKQEVNTLIGQITTVSIQVVQALPQEGQSNVIYFVPKVGTTGDIYNEYIYVNNNWELIGSTQVDLTGYATESWVNGRISAFLTQAQIETLINNTVPNNSNLLNGSAEGSLRNVNSAEEGETYITLSDEFLDKIFDNEDYFKQIYEQFINPVEVILEDEANSIEKIYAIGESCNAEGESAIAMGAASHAEGVYTVADGDDRSGRGTHAEGNNTLAVKAAHAEGMNTLAAMPGAHAEGSETAAFGLSSHAEGHQTLAVGGHAEGANTLALLDSHAEGWGCAATGMYSHAEGNTTVASSSEQHVQGRYNIEDSENKYAHIVGNGEYDNRSNAHTVDWDGVGWFAGGVKVGGTGQDDVNAQTLYTKPSTGIPKTHLASAVQTSLNKADTALQSHQDISGKQNITDNSLITTNKTISSAINEVNSIAKGANQALSYSNYSSMITAFNSLANNVHNVGQNVMIVTLNVPDLWISSIESTSTAYSYTTDEAFTTTLSTNGYVQVGYYRLSALETQKVDLTGYARAQDIPTNLSDLNDNSTHRLVTDAEKNTWNSKANISDIPDTSSFITNTVNNLTNYYTKTAIDTALNNYINEVASLVGGDA